MKRLLILVLLLLAVSLDLWAAAITGATVYPAGATVTLTEETGPGSLNVRLPNSCDPASLMLKLSDSRFKLREVELVQVARTTSPEIVSLKARINETKAQRQQTAAAQEACEAEQGFWKGALNREWPTALEALKLNEAARTNLPRLIRQRQDLNLRLTETDRRLKELEERLKELGGGGEQDWSVRLELDGPPQARTRLLLSCFVRDCGYAPAYRLNALPDKGQIEFDYEARIWQKTGFDWTGVRLTLASLRQGTAVNPPELQPWFVDVRQNFIKGERLLYKAAPAEMAMSVDAAGASPVLEEQRGTYTEWQLGSVNLATGPGRLFRIAGEIWPAEFAYRLRPEQGPLGFLEARVSAAEGRQLPSGEALCLVDGAMVGRQVFDQAAREQILYFGPDSLIRCERKLVEHKTGALGLVRSGQTYAWDYELKLVNERRKAVQVMVEEAKPQARDERIRVTLKPQPAFSSQDETKGIWEFKLEPRSSLKLQYGIRLESGLDLNPGR